MNSKSEFTVALAGNPNVGKSTVFNALTGAHQHTGNWPGKTVSSAVGSFDADGVAVRLVDIPGTYSLCARSPDEQVAHDYICGAGDCGAERQPPCAVIVVCDACSMRRSLELAEEIAQTSLPYMLCINLADEADSRGITVDHVLLESLLNVPVVRCAARSGAGLPLLKSRLGALLRQNNEGKESPCSRPTPKELCDRCVKVPDNADRRDRALDRILAGKLTAVPIAVLFLAFVFFLTVKGASPLSEGLAYIFDAVLRRIRSLLLYLGVPYVIRGALCDGILYTTFEVTAVMLPPMAVFFPLFTFLEDLGYLPRVAYSFDRCFKGCRACGKQALTMMMGLGCNAAGVTGCRIIDSPRERLIAMVTNSLMPCNGRLAVIAAIASASSAVTGLAFGAMPALILFGAVALGTVLTLILSRLLSATLMRGSPSSFTLELPPYRLPDLRKLIVRSVLDRTVFVLGRAVAVAAPAGLVIWFLCNTGINGTSLFEHMTRLLDPVGRIAGMDGVIMCAFILALPAAELILPLMLMGYSSSGFAQLSQFDGIGEILRHAGWTPVTVLCTVLFTLVHFPCSTTVITVKRESGSIFWAVMSAVIPTVMGFSLCVLLNLILG